MELPELVVAFLVAHAVNTMEEGDCCPHSCAPCMALFWLHEKGQLEEALKPYIEMSGAGWDWWDEEDEKFLWKFVQDRWCDPDNCEYLRGIAEEDGVSYEEAKREWMSREMSRVGAHRERS